MVSAQRADVMLRLCQQGTGLVRVAEEHAAGCGEHDMPPGAIKELDSQIFFKRLDLQTHSRLRKIKFFSSLAEAEVCRNRPENNQPEVLKARHRGIKTLLSKGRNEFQCPFPFSAGKTAESFLA